MNTTLDLPDDLYQDLEAESALRGTELRELVMSLIRSGLPKRQRGGSPSRQRSPLPSLQSFGGQMHPSLTNAEIEDILTAEEADACA